MLLLFNNIYITGVIAFPDEDTMMDRIWLVCGNTSYCPVVAGIVFENLPSSGTQLPDKTKYTIRVFANVSTGKNHIAGPSAT